MSTDPGAGPADRKWTALALSVVCFFALGWSLYASHTLGFRIVGQVPGELWFDSDPDRIFGQMTDRNYPNLRMIQHPAFPLIGYLWTAVPRIALGIPPWEAVRGGLALLAAGWAGLLYSTFLRLGARTAGALLFTLLGLGSSASLFWWGVPESFVFGSTSILLLFWLYAGKPGNPPMRPWVLLAGTLAYGTTVTNWSVALVAAALHHPRKQAVSLAAFTMGLVLISWVATRLLFPHATFFVPHKASAVRTQAEQVHRYHPGAPAGVVRALLVHSVVAPHYQVRASRGIPGRHEQMSFQSAAIGSTGFSGLLAAGLWLGLLGLGIVSTLHLKAHRRFCALIWLSVTGQVLVHLIYGDETFLYTPHVLPMLILAAGIACLGPQRRLALTLCAALCLAAGWNNLLAFDAGVAYFGGQFPR